MLTPEDQTPEGIYQNVRRIILAEAKIWAEMRNRPEPLFDLKPDAPAPAGMKLDSNNWRGKVSSICAKLHAQGYPALSEREIIVLSNNTLAKPIAVCHADLQNAIKKKLQPSLTDRMFAGLAEAVAKVTGRS